MPATATSQRSRDRKTAATSSLDARAPDAPPRSGTRRPIRVADTRGSTARIEEHLAPRHQLAQRTAHQHAERGPDAQPGERHPLPDREAVGRGRGRDDRAVVGEVHPLRETGDEARQHQGGQSPGQARGERRGRDQQDADDEDALPAEPVAQESRRDLHRHVAVEEHREQEAALGVAQAELGHDGLEQRGEGHAHDVVADPAEDQKRPDRVVGLPGHGGLPSDRQCRQVSDQREERVA